MHESETSYEDISKLTSREARNLGALYPLIEFWSEDFAIVAKEQDAQALGCSCSKCTSKSKSVFIAVN